MNDKNENGSGSGPRRDCVIEERTEVVKVEEGKVGRRRSAGVEEGKKEKKE